MRDHPTIAVIGGTGALGGALAVRWAAAGYSVVIGSRSTERAETAAAAMHPGPKGPPVRGMTNTAAAAAADVIVLTVPFAHQAPTLREIVEPARGKIVIDTTAPLVPPRVATVQLSADGPAGSVAQQLLGPETRVVSAFQNVAAAKLRGTEPVDCDVLVSGNSEEARAIVIGLAAAIGLRALHAGPIANSVAAEALTSVLIGINRRYKVDGAGIRITGLPGG